MIKFQGGCHSTQVLFQTKFDPSLVYQCNCQICRRKCKAPFQFLLSMGKKNQKLMAKNLSSLLPGVVNYQFIIFHALITQIVFQSHLIFWMALSRFRQKLLMMLCNSNQRQKYSQIIRPLEYVKVDVLKSLLRNQLLLKELE